MHETFQPTNTSTDNTNHLNLLDILGDGDLDSTRLAARDSVSAQPTTAKSVHDDALSAEQNDTESGSDVGDESGFLDIPPLPIGGGEGGGGVFRPRDPNRPLPAPAESTPNEGGLPSKTGSGGRETSNGGAQNDIRPQPTPDRPTSTSGGAGNNRDIEPPVEPGPGGRDTGGGAQDATGPRQVTDHSTSTADDIVQRRGDEPPVEPGSGDRDTGGGEQDATRPRQVTDHSTSTADDIVQRRGADSPVEPGSGGREAGNGGAQDATRPQPMPDRPASTAVDQRQ